MRISDWSSDVCSSDLARSEIAESSERIRGLLFLSLALSVAAVLSALWGLRIMSRTVVRPLEQMASALSADRLPATIPSAASEDEIGQVARALVARSEEHTSELQSLMPT